MLDSPTPVEILEVVAAMIRDQLVPQLAPDAVFHARVAANAIDLVRRQLQTGDALEAASLVRLQQLLGQQLLGPQLLGHQSDAAALERELCERIRSGSLTTDSPGLIDHLMACTLAKMSIDQPSYASYRRELDARATTPHIKE
jgi:Domain of unknown function (DUF6285)